MAYTMLTRLVELEYNTGDIVEVQHASTEELIHDKKVAFTAKYCRYLFFFSFVFLTTKYALSQTWHRAIIVSKLDSKDGDKYQIKWINFPTAKPVGVLASCMRPVLPRTLRSDSVNGLRDNGVKN